MNKKIEYWDLFDIKTNKLVGTMRRGEKLIPVGTYHITVEVIPTDMKGRVLVTRRAFTKARGGGQYEFPAGSVLAGEKPIDAAQRELFEETGLTAKKLHPITTRLIKGVGGGGCMLRCFYLAHIPNLLSKEIILQEGETISYSFDTLSEWMDRISRGSFISERVMAYNETFYATIFNLVGKTTTKKKAEKIPEMVPCDVIRGTRQGTSGKEIAFEELNQEAYVPGGLVPLDEETEYNSTLLEPVLFGESTETSPAAAVGFLLTDGEDSEPEGGGTAQ